MLTVKYIDLRNIEISTIVFIFPIVVIYFMPMKIFGFAVKNELVLLLSMSLFIVSFGFFNFSFRHHGIKYLIYGLAFSSIFLFILLKNQEIFIIKDIVECFKPLYFFVIFLCGKEASKIYKVASVCRLVATLLVIGVVFSFLVYFEFSYPLLDLFKGRTSDEGNLYHFFRFSGFFGYPSMFGIYLIFGMFLTINFDHSKYKKLTLGLMFLGFILTMSKTGFVLFLLISVYYLVKKGSFATILYSLSGVFMIGTIIILYYNEEFAIVFSAFSSLDGLLASTFSHRFREIIEAVQILTSENFDGFGPSNLYLKMNHGPVENVIFFYVFKFGYFGLIYYLNLIFFTAYLFINEKNDSKKLVFFWCLLALLIGSLAESITEEYKTLYFFPLVLGYFSSLKLKKYD